MANLNSTTLLAYSMMLIFNANIVGIVLNRVDTQRAGYAEYYSRYTNCYIEGTTENIA